MHSMKSEINPNPNEELLICDPSQRVKEEKYVETKIGGKIHLLLMYE